MAFPLKFVSTSEEDTANAAKAFAGIVKPGNIVLFEGDLGVGKTFFIKKLVEIFGVKDASSPSFSIVNEYYGKVNFYHFDFYRIKKEVELYDIGIEEYLSDPDSIKLVEWAELFPNVFEMVDYKVKITMLGADKREILIEGFNN
ncbi:MAG: tRNA (adenosine(37)-N6)-threonylcarbamoyltransferase complex ATPase subunit type 1 TsaE [Melioribacteraceae bacterium]|nr:MAG: tRNA (adenosine(37)-N6)-threonylcarbamoyltransferase complex ATPase subunit type 1 TsaE [Melioribacteraceae bacterium]